MLEEDNNKEQVLSDFSSILCNAVVSAVEKEDEYFAIYNKNANDDYHYDYTDSLYYMSYKTKEEFDEATQQNASYLSYASQIRGELLVNSIDTLHAQKADIAQNQNRVRARLLENYYNARIDLLENELDMRYSPQYLKDEIEEIPFTPDKQTIERDTMIENGEIDLLDIDFEL